MSPNNNNDDPIHTPSAGSPKNRVKFLCSHGGKILPRPADAHLKYVGGETRVISVNRDIPFQELMKKLTFPTDGEILLKYQVVSEDLDALVSVKTDEDVRHMCDEIDRYATAGTPRLRAFLFPSNPHVFSENQIGPVDHHALEQRYIDAINGITRSPLFMKQHPTINSVQQGSLVSSGCTSPGSPDSCTTEALPITPQTNITSYHNSRLSSIHKVHSSPSISTMNVPQQHFAHQVPTTQQHYPLLNQSQKVGPERLTNMRLVDRAEGVRYHQVDPSPHYYYVSRPNRGRGGGCTTCIHYDECGRSDRRMVQRAGLSSLPMSPGPSSPRFGHGG